MRPAGAYPVGAAPVPPTPRYA